MPKAINLNVPSKSKPRLRMEASKRHEQNQQTRAWLLEVGFLAGEAQELFRRLNKAQVSALNENTRG